MKYAIVILAAVFLSGCSVLSNKDYTNYVEAVKSVSKDATVASAACANAKAEIAKAGTEAAKTAAILEVDKCLIAPQKIEPPKKGWFK
jgi:hydroxylamine reductase (hybrid-cluster protein)